MTYFCVVVSFIGSFIATIYQVDDLAVKKRKIESKGKKLLSHNQGKVMCWIIVCGTMLGPSHFCGVTSQVESQGY